MSLWRNRIALAGLAAFVVSACGSGVVESAPSVTIPVTLSPSTSLTAELNTLPSTSFPPGLSWGIEVTIPGQEDPILITTPETPERRVAEDTTTNSISDTAEDVGMDPLEPEKVQYASPFVIVGEVARIEGPFWNQANGQRWSGDSAIYREVSLNVDRVIADPLDVIGGSVEILVHGGGTEDESEPWLGGYLVEGEDVVMFFGVRSWEQRESRLLAFVPSWGSLGIYHLRRDSGVVHVVPDTEVHDAGRFLSFDPRGFPTLEKFLRDVRDLRSEERPEFGTAVPTRKHVLDELAFYQEWTETGEPPIADPPPRTEP